MRGDEEKKQLQEKREDFKSKIAQDKAMAEEQEASTLQPSGPTRSIKRKPDVPKANARNFNDENQRMGVNNELDLFISASPQKQVFAKDKISKGLIEYTHQ